jgi:hypothetical protein
MERASGVRHRLSLTRAAHLDMDDVAAIPVLEREEEIRLVLPMLAYFLEHQFCTFVPGKKEEIRLVLTMLAYT